MMPSPQFTLRALLLDMLVVAGVCRIGPPLKWKYEDWRQHREMAEAYERCMQPSATLPMGCEPWPETTLRGQQ